jgi:hypothetical protein
MTIFIQSKELASITSFEFWHLMLPHEVSMGHRIIIRLVMFNLFLFAKWTLTHIFIIIPNNHHNNNNNILLTRKKILLDFQSTKIVWTTIFSHKIFLTLCYYYKIDPQHYQKIIKITQMETWAQRWVPTTFILGGKKKIIILQDYYLFILQDLMKDSWPLIRWISQMWVILHLGDS